ncbi:hypothetical protein [Halomonas sp. GD1P12]|uniref:hypothetical protein n=1 Tax=Halomonas sp. GD1P12 TaxID=2982691 RepID=UPI0021E4F2B6|nr:hypothetical protein [Halomonas sp. GD1P12]UYG01315.1 hypothetical protein OCT39_07110 [Halomonas sp. GD1P12]
MIARTLTSLRRLLGALTMHAALATLLSATVLADTEPAPAISATFDDEPMAWYLHGENEDVSASFVEQRQALVVDITGFTDASDPSPRDSLALRLSLSEAGETLTLEQAEAVYFISSDTTGPVYHAAAGALNVTLTRAERDGAWLTLVGRIDGDFELERAPGGQSENEPATLSGRFELRARRVEF